MAKSIPYMTSVKNLPLILEKIRSAGTPPRFTYEFLKANLGFPSSNDRTVIGVLRALGFLAADGTPTARYGEYRDGARSGRALASGLREGWADVFLSDQRANERSSAQLTELFKSVAGVGEGVAQKMATTFKAVAGKADWSVDAPAPNVEAVSSQPDLPTLAAIPRSSGLNLHHDIHIHLPPTSDVAVYTAIFRALRSELID